MIPVFFRSFWCFTKQPSDFSISTTRGFSVTQGPRCDLLFFFASAVGQPASTFGGSLIFSRKNEGLNLLLAEEGSYIGSFAYFCHTNAIQIRIIGTWTNQDFMESHTPRKFNSSPLKIGNSWQFPKGNSSEPTIIFQGRKCYLCTSWGW